MQEVKGGAWDSTFSKSAQVMLMSLEKKTLLQSGAFGEVPRFF